MEVTASFYKRKTYTVGWHPPYQQMRRDIKMAEFHFLPPIASAAGRIDDGSYAHVSRIEGLDLNSSLLPWEEGVEDTFKYIASPSDRPINYFQELESQPMASLQLAPASAPLEESKYGFTDSSSLLHPASSQPCIFSDSHYPKKKRSQKKHKKGELNFRENRNIAPRMVRNLQQRLLNKRDPETATFIDDIASIIKKYSNKKAKQCIEEIAEDAQRREFLISALENEVFTMEENKWQHHIASKSIDAYICGYFRIIQELKQWE